MKGNYKLCSYSRGTVQRWCYPAAWGDSKDPEQRRPTVSGQGSWPVIQACPEPTGWWHSRGRGQAEGQWSHRHANCGDWTSERGKVPARRNEDLEDLCRQRGGQGHLLQPQGKSSEESSAQEEAEIHKFLRLNIWTSQQSFSFSHPGQTLFAGSIDKKTFIDPMSHALVFSHALCSFLQWYPCVSAGWLQF